MAGQVTTINSAEIRRRKIDLESRLKELLGAARLREDLQIDYVADPLDQVKSSTDREMVVQRLDYQTRLIHEIQSALTKIEEDTYGLCERCDEPIPRSRLNAVPWARLCVHCQSAEEAAKQNGEPTFEDAA